ncbi:uncharacterized protein PRCAT00006008001 [Priceomyces carsonii]|uniref:uncharacterized protein n=1 Tax=Priceomyces carsonii TaxID=28549 RepID=UPI002ED8229E|nr:unnamed protein product [Priceomyces carsonii]
MGLTSKLEKLKLKSGDEKQKSNSSVNEAAESEIVSPSDSQEKTKKEDTNGESSGEYGDTDDIDEIDNEGQSILLAIIAQLRPGCDLSKITLPTFILEKKSMLERITNFFQIPDILIDANAEDDDLRRFILIVKWYLASWHIAPKAVKKPLNPVLGEIFSCYWDKLPDGSSAYYVAEQTSHHPPKSCYFYLVPELKIKADGILIPQSRFLGNSSAALMHGWAHLTFGQRDDETYIMNQPNIYCRGILFGKLKYELGDHMLIECPKTGYEADIEFKTKGFISGTYDAIEGTIKNTKTSESLYTITGKWNEIMYIKDNKTGKKEVLFDCSKTKSFKPKVRPLNEQFDNESRKLWGPTCQALAHRDHHKATEEKSKVEDYQRVLAKKRAEIGEPFEPKLFKDVTHKDTDPEHLEYVIYKDFDLLKDPDELKKEFLDMVPVLPGQESNDNINVPASEKS